MAGLGGEGDGWGEGSGWGWGGGEGGRWRGMGFAYEEVRGRPGMVGKWLHWEDACRR